MKRKKLLRVVIVFVAVVLGVAVTGYLVMRSSGGVFARASSLRFSVAVSQNATSRGNYTFVAKNAGTSNMTMRIETTSTAGNVTYIIDGVKKKAWVHSDDGWQDLSDAFTTQWKTWSSELKEYADKLGGWTSGDLTYTAPNGDTVRIYDIALDPALADSLFQPG